VFYRRGPRLIAYTIVAGKPLPAVSGALSAVRAGITLTYSTLDGRQVVSWLRRGHTCVLSARGMSLDALTALAVWRGLGGIPY
jgi:hypothetical protein